MSEFSLSKKVTGIAFATALGLGLVGCGAGESAPTDTPSATASAHPTVKPTIKTENISCKADDVKSWGTNPENMGLDAKMLAGALHVDIQKVREGKYGNATCETPVSLDAITTGEAFVAVEGLASNCAVIGVGDTPMQQSTQHVMAACPAA